MRDGRVGLDVQSVLCQLLLAGPRRCGATIHITVGQGSEEQKCTTCDMLDGEDERPIDVHFDRRACWFASLGEFAVRSSRCLSAPLVDAQESLVK